MSPLVSQKVPSLLNGVSQRDERVRPPSQLEEQKNGLARPSQGDLRKRPPTEYGGELEAGVSSYADGAFVHPIDRDRGNKFRAVIRDGDLKVFDVLDNSEVDVLFPDGKGYLAGGDDFRAVSVEDKTYILNRDTAAAQDATASEDRDPEALVYVAAGNHETLYKVTVDDYEGSFTTAVSDSANPPDTTIIAQELLSRLKANSGFDGDFDSELIGSTIYLKKSSGNEFSISTEDGLEDIGLVAIKNTVQAFEGLPRTTKEGFTVEVVGHPGTEFDNYWVQYQRDVGEEEGIWKEVVEPGVLTSFDPESLPHVLTLRGLFEGRAVALEPPKEPVIFSGGTEETDYQWDTLEDAGSNAISDGDTTIISGHEDYVEWDPPSSLDDLVMGVTVRFRMDTTGLDVTDSILVELIHWDGMSETTITSHSYSSDLDGIFSLSGDITPDSGDTVRLKITHVPSSLTGSDPAVTVYPLGEPGKEPIQVSVPGTLVDFGRNQMHPGSFKITITANGQFGWPTDSWEYTPTEDESGIEVAEAFQALIDADADYGASLVSDGIVVIQIPDQYLVSIDPTLEFDTSTDVWLAGDAPLANVNLVGTTVTNVTDGSTTAVGSHTDTAIKGSSGLSGGTDNTFSHNDLIEVSESGTYFVFEEVEWEPREAGDDVTNAFPDFVGHTITDVSFYQGRLAFLYADRVYFSAAGDHRRFWRKTARQVLADDPVGAESSLPNVSAFDSAIAWNKGFYLKAENSLVLVSGSPVLTPTTVRMDLVASFHSSGSLRPIVVGRSLFVAREKQGNTIQMQELIQQEVDVIIDRDVTLDVPTYLLGTPRQLAGSGALGLLAVLPEESGEVYIYKYLDQGQERVQASWSTWEFNGEVLALDVIDGKLGLVVKHSDGVYLETINLDQAADEQVVHLDRRLTNDTTGVSEGHSGGVTTWTLPYDVPVDEDVSVVNQSTFERYDTTRPAANQVAVSGQGDLSNTAVYIGVPYTYQAVPTQLFYRDQNGFPDVRGRLALRFLDIGYHLSTDFKVTVESLGRNPAVYTISHLELTSGSLRIPVMARNSHITITIENDTPGDTGISYIEWEGWRTTRSRR